MIILSYVVTAVAILIYMVTRPDSVKESKLTKAYNAQKEAEFRFGWPLAKAAQNKINLYK